MTTSKIVWKKRFRPDKKSFTLYGYEYMSGNRVYIDTMRIECTVLRKSVEVVKTIGWKIVYHIKITSEKSDENRYEYACYVANKLKTGDTPAISNLDFVLESVNKKANKR